jgi:quinol monooxygenase YgiN
MLASGDARPSPRAGPEKHEETTMPVTVLLELKFKPDAVPAARELMARTLKVTRGFEGSLQVDVLVDSDDEAHWIVYELWESVEADEAYRAFRAGEGKVTELPPLLAAPPVKTRFETADV